VAARGNVGSLANAVSPATSPIKRCISRTPLTAAESRCNGTTQHEDGQSCSGLHEPSQVHRILAGLWIISIAKEKKAINDCSDLSARCLKQSKPYVLDRVIDAVQVARDLAFRSDREER